MSLNKEFKQAIIDNQYYYSAFDGKIHDINDLQVCHILSKSKRTLNSIKNAYGCSTKTADILMNMPLLNTVIGTRKDNTEYKKTDDIVCIDYSICRIVYDLIISKDLALFVGIFDKLIILLNVVYYNLNSLSNDNLFITKKIKDIQYQFHKEIDLHI